MWDKNYLDMEKLKVGRPKLSDKDKKKVNLKVRLSDDELQKIRALYNLTDDYNLSLFVREILLKNPILIKVKYLEKLKAELTQVRNNFKDLKRKYDVEEIKENLETLNKTHENITSLIKELKDSNIEIQKLS